MVLGLRPKSHIKICILKWEKANNYPHWHALYSWVVGGFWTHLGEESKFSPPPIIDLRGCRRFLDNCSSE